MPAGRPCKICQDSTKARQAAQLVASGLTDEAVGKQLGVSRAAAQRHRTLHIVAPARALVQAAAKDAPAKEKRAEILAAAEAGDPTAFVELAAIVSDLKKVHQRLERTADAAEEDNQRLAVASLSSQQLRAAEEPEHRCGGVGDDQDLGDAHADRPADLHCLVREPARRRDRPPQPTAKPRHPADLDVLNALITISRDAGDRAAALGYAEELVRLVPGSADARALRDSLR